MPTHDQDKAYDAAVKAAGVEPTPELRAIFDAGYTARGEHDTKAIRNLRKGGWVLPDIHRWFNFALDDAIQRIRYVGGAERRVRR